MSSPLTALKRPWAFALLAVVPLGLAWWWLASRPSARVALYVPAGGANESYWAVAYSPDGKTLAGASHDKKVVRLWDAADARPLRTLRGHSGPVYRVCFSGDGRLLASSAALAGESGEIKVWDVAAGREVIAPRGGACGPVALDADGSLLAGYAPDETLKVWDTATGA